MSKPAHRLAALFALAAVLFTIGSARAEYTAANYVQNGLVACWDGAENAVDGNGDPCHNPEATTWRDLVGGYEFELSNVTIEDACVSFKGASNSYGLLAAEDAAKAFPANGNDKTIEIILSMESTGNFIPFYGPTAANVAFGPYGGRIIIVGGNNSSGATYSSVPTAGSTNAFSTVYKTGPQALYQNGAVATAGGNDRWSRVQDYAKLNASENSYPGEFKGKIFALRVYNRALTAQEVAYNNLIDQARYLGEEVDESAFKELGFRSRADGLCEYYLSVNAGADGWVKVTANGETTAAAALVELWLTNGAPVTVEYLPNTEGDWRFFSGTPAGVTYPSPTTTTFVMGAEKCLLEAGEYPYSDENIVSVAPVTKTTPYVGRVVYTFADATVGRQPFFLKQAMTYEESLVVAGGGGGSANYGCGGGGGGVIRNADAKVFAPGESMIVTVGAGGAIANPGKPSALEATGLSVSTLGGGGGASGQATLKYLSDGGSGGGGNIYVTGSGTPGQGFNGGGYNYSINYNGGGGGGAGGPGGSPVKGATDAENIGGQGGVGRWDNITGTLHCYASGGGGSLNTSTIPGEGGAESGGRGGGAGATQAGAGADGLGGGGGGATSNGTTGGKGGSGTVIVAFSTTDTTDKRFAFEPFDSYPIVNGAATPKPVVTVGGTTLAEGADYVLYYENNTQNGALAYAVVVGKEGTAYEGQVIRQMFRPAGIHYVKSVATGRGDGSDWANAMTLEEAVNGLANGTYDIWCAAGTYDLSGIPDGLTIPCETAIRGGFAADATDILKKDPNGEKTIFDGAGVSKLFFDVTYSCGDKYFGLKEIVFEDCTFTRCNGLAVRANNKATPFTFTRCDFKDNVSGYDYDGIAFYISGASSAPVNFMGCRFEGNVNKIERTRSVLHFADAKFAVDGCLFVTNGVPLTQTRSNLGNQIATRIITASGCAADSKVANCDFRGNFFSRWCQAAYGIYVNGTKMAIENCRFVGNSYWNFFNAYGPADAVVYVGGGSASTPVAINNCTFAYNALDAYGDASSCVRTGGASPVAVENCIFWQNVQDATNTGKRDFHGSNATLTYSLFAELETAGSCVNVEPGTGCITDDPLFVTTNPIADYLKTGLAAGRVALDPAKIDDILAIDVHLLSPEAYSKNDGSRVEGDDKVPLSPAIDAGNPEADYANEPGRNGGRLNMGGYGNTTEASETPFCDPAIVSVTVDYPDGLTQPRITMQVGGKGVFVGTAIFYISTDGGATYQASEELGALNGSTVSWRAPFFLEPGAAIKFYATLAAAGADTKTSTPADSTATGTKPPWEKPGDVVLVTAEGTPNGSGQSWASPLDFTTAFNNLTKNPNTEIWLKAETFALTNGTLDIRAAGKILGGFAADPTVVTRKAADGAKTVFDGANIATRLFNSFYSCAAADFATKPIVFEDCAFTRCVGTAVYSSGRSTPFVFKNCDFRSNVSGYDYDGIAFCISGASSAPVNFTGCRFEGNVNKIERTRSVLHFAGAKFAVDGCLFVTNGAPLTQTRSNLGNQIATRIITASGCAADSNVSNCDFRGNFFTRWCQAAYGVYVNGTKMSIENCRFVGNSYWNFNSAYGPADAVVYVGGGSASTPVAINNCTFAYNALDANGDACSCVRTGGTSPVAVENCIFWQNVQDTTNKGKRDFHGSNATLTYSLFAELETAGSCVNVEPGVGCITDDPLFVTTNPIADYLKTGLAEGRVSLDPAKIDDILAINVHLGGTGGYVDESTGEKVKGHGKASPCINKGNPESDWSQEPVPNGKRINLGGYGGTPYATCTPGGGALFIR